MTQTPDDLLDLFAAVALHGLLAASDGEVRHILAKDAAAHGEQTTSQTYARLAWDQAEAMVVERARRKGRVTGQ